MLFFGTPRIELAPYITKVWLFESDSGLPANNLIAPNARPKIIISYKNSITTTDSKKTRTVVESGVYFIGVRDVPVLLETPKAKSGSIGIELTTMGAYKFSRVPMRDFKNDVFSFSDCFGENGAELTQQLADTEDPHSKIECVQNFLLKQLQTHNRTSQIFEYCVDLINQSQGLIEINQLERKTGYSRRYLDMLFSEHLGISPKALATILRFQKFYKVLSAMNSDYLKNEIYDLYYDESHFVKEFKRYTGFSPTRFAVLPNDFGKNF